MDFLFTAVVSLSALVAVLTHLRGEPSVIFVRLFCAPTTVYQWRGQDFFRGGGGDTVVWSTGLNGKVIMVACTVQANKSSQQFCFMIVFESGLNWLKERSRKLINNLFTRTHIGRGGMSPCPPPGYATAVYWLSIGRSRLLSIINQIIMKLTIKAAFITTVHSPANLVGVWSFVIPNRPYPRLIRDGLQAS